MHSVLACFQAGCDGVRLKLVAGVRARGLLGAWGLVTFVLSFWDQCKIFRGLHAIGRVVGHTLLPLSWVGLVTGLHSKSTLKFLGQKRDFCLLAVK